MSLSSSAVSRVTGVAVNFKNFNAGSVQMLQQRLAVFGVGNDGVSYTEDKYECQGSASEIGEKYGYGSPLHLAALQLFPVAGKGAGFPVTFYPISKANDSIAARGRVAVSGAATESGGGKVVVGGQKASFSVAKGDEGLAVLDKIKTAVNTALSMPVSAELAEIDEYDEDAGPSLVLTSKASGDVGNLVKVRVDCDVEGVSFQTANLSGGAGDPEITDALARIGEVWETAILPCFSYKDTDRLDAVMNFGKGRWDQLEKKPCLAFWGCTDGYAERTAITDARKADYINALVVSAGSPELPYAVAAKAMVSDILTTACENPPQNYKGLLEGLEAGPDSAQESYNIRNESCRKGSSTNIKNGSAAELCDVVTMYHPDNEGDFPSRKYVVDLVKLENIVYNVRLIMESDELKGAPLVSDSTVTSNKAAVQPKMVKAMFLNLANSLADKAIIQDVDATKEGLDVSIDSANPKRLNVVFPAKLSGNVEVVSTDIYFGFYVGK